MGSELYMMLGHFVIPIFVCFYFVSSASGEDLLLSVRQIDDVVVHLPPSFKSNISKTSKSNTSKPIYMVIALHGMGPNYPDLFQHEIAWNSVADSTGEFVVVYPLGSVCIGGSGLCGHTWNGGACCFSTQDDSSFLLDVFDAVKEKLPYLSEKAVVVGFSAGGVMAHRIACQHPDIVSAAISVGGPLEVPCTNSSAVPIMHWHGTLDPLFPWYGGIYHSVPYTMGVWRDNNRCEDEGEENWLDFGILRTIWQCGDGQSKVVQIAIEGGGHSWPPARAKPEQEMWTWASSVFE